MKHTFFPQGVCSTRIDLEIEGDTIGHIAFIDGCSGNLQGVAKLAEGRKISEVIAAIEGIRCEDGETSCPDQLAKALKAIEETL